MNSENASTIITYIPEIIGIVGTILGTVLGWLLSYITGNWGQIRITIESFEEKKSKSDQYGCIISLFGYNSSVKPRYMRNIKILFCNKKRKKIFETYAYLGACNFENMPHDNIINQPITYSGNTSQNIILSALVENENFESLSKVGRVYLEYETENNKIKKKKIKKSFCVNSVETSDWNSF